MTSYTGNNCASWLHCGSACDCKGHLHLQMSWDIVHKTFDSPSSIFTTSHPLSSQMTVEINVRKIPSSGHFPFFDEGQNSYSSPQTFYFNEIIKKSKLSVFMKLDVTWIRSTGHVQHAWMFDVKFSFQIYFSADKKVPTRNVDFPIQIWL